MESRTRRCTQASWSSARMSNSTRSRPTWDLSEEVQGLAHLYRADAVEIERPAEGLKA
jgi:hypothetical protein